MQFKNKKNVIVFSQNAGPFRIAWLDELSKYYNITFQHIGDYASSVSRQYIDGIKSNNIKIVCSYINLIDKIRLHKFKLCDIKKYDYVLIDGYGYLGGIVLIFLLSILHIKFFMSIDGIFKPSNSNYIKSNGFIRKRDGFFQFLIKKFCLNKADFILSTGEYSDITIKSYCKNAKIYRHILSNIKLNSMLSLNNNYYDIKRTYRKELDINDDVFYLIYVGQFIKRKNIDLLLYILERLPLNIELICIGDFKTKEYSNELLYKVRDRVHFVNFLSQNDIKKYLIASNVFVMPTLHDVWGLVVLEAIAFGLLPIISTDMCLAAKELVVNDYNGYIISSDNAPLYNNYEIVDGFVEKIISLYNDKNLCKKFMKNNELLKDRIALDNICKLDYNNIEDFYATS